VSPLSVLAVLAHAAAGSPAKMTVETVEISSERFLQGILIHLARSNANNSIDVVDKNLPVANFVCA